MRSFTKHVSTNQIYRELNFNKSFYFKIICEYQNLKIENSGKDKDWIIHCMRTAAKFTKSYSIVGPAP